MFKVAFSVFFAFRILFVPIQAFAPTQILPYHRQTELGAKGKQKKRATRNSVKNRTRSISGFGGAAIEPCPCGSSSGYMKCCGKLHKESKVYGAAKAEQVVRARYSAYAKREIDFIIGSTHPLNKAFMTDIEHWRETIETNCYDNFELTKCLIIDEEHEGDGEKQIARVKFIATMIQIDSREQTSFMETSTFERAGKHIREGAWLYKSGEVEPVEIVEKEISADLIEEALKVEKEA